jgi:hypothetical protein
MLPLDLSDNQTIIAIGLSVVALVFILRRTVMRTGRASRRLPISQTPAEIEAAEESAAALVEHLEVRLYDFAREVEGRMHTKIAVLDRLIVNADREIIRLEQVLAESRRLGSPATSAGRQPDAIVSTEPGEKDQRHAA